MDTPARGSHLLIWILLYTTVKDTRGQVNCPPRRAQLSEKGRSCPFPCKYNNDCQGPETRNCDGKCGMSCFFKDSKCPSDIAAPVNGKVMKPSVNLTYGVRIWFVCDNGYRLSRMDGRICRSDQKWSGVTPSCLPKLCTKPPKPYHGYVTHRQRNEWPFGSEATYFCDTGFVIRDAKPGESVLRRCGLDGMWTGELPVCVAAEIGPKRVVVRTCNSPPLVANGWFQLDGSSVGIRPPALNLWKADDIIIYRCKPGFDLVGGDLRRVCEWEGGWTGNQPRCVPSIQKSKEVYCESPAHLQNGWVEIDRNVGDVEQPRPPIAPDNDDFAPTLVEIRWRKEDVLLYRCKSRYQLTGNKRRICKSDATWTGSQPRCILKEAINCPAPIRPIGGFIFPRVKPIWKAGDVYSISCDTGYKVPSQNWAKCLEDGTWSPTALRCEEKDATCSRPPRVVNGWYKRESGGFPVGQSWPAGSVIVFICFPDFEMNGGNGRFTCVNGQWSGNRIHCTAQVSCLAPSVSNGEIIPLGITKWIKGDTFSIKCLPGYKEPNPNLSTCQSDGNWSPPLLTCTARASCPNPSNIENGQILSERYGRGPFSGVQRVIRWNLGDVITYNCDDGYQMAAGDRRRVCTSAGIWGGIEPYCREIIKCDNPVVKYGTIDSEGKYSWFPGDTFQIECHPGFLPPSDNLSRCLANGVWSPPELKCNRPSGHQYCPSPKIKNGWVVSDRNVPHSPGQQSHVPPMQSASLSINVRWVKDDAILYRCKDGFHLDGNERRICTGRGTWTGTQPTCQGGQSNYCPDPSKVDNGFIESDRNIGLHSSLQQQWIPRVKVRWIKGNVIRYRCEDGYTLEGGNDRRICTGDGRWSGTEPRCKRDTSTEPGTGSTQWRRMSSGLFYSVTPTTGSFSEAILGCANMGGRLAATSITTILREVFGPTGITKFGESYWVGLSDREFEQNWKWLDGSRMNPDKLWQRFSRNDILIGHEKDCAVIVANPAEKWRAEDCGNEHFAICESNTDNEGVGPRSPLRKEEMSPTSGEDAFVVVPIRIQGNDTAFEVTGCDPNPCLNGCECEESPLYGYFCNAVGEEQFLGSNCEYDPPVIECGHDAIEISISAEFISGMDDGVGNGVAYIAPDEELAQNLSGIQDRCRFTRSPSDDSFRVFIPFPFDSCGTFAEIRNEGEMSFGNLIWFSRDLALGADIPVHSSVAEISCSYQDIYRVTSVIDAICCPTPPIITSNGVFLFETTIWADPPGVDGSDTLPDGRNRTEVDVTEDGFVSYRVGEMLYLTVEMKSRHASSALIPALRRCWLSSDVSSRDSRTGSDLILHPASNSSALKTYGPVNTGRAVHFGFQLIRAKRSSIVYLHCQIQVVSRRARRSLKDGKYDESGEVSILTKGPIVLVNPPPLGATRDELDMKRIDGESDPTYRLVIGISFFGVAALALMFACCLAHLRSIHAREQRPAFMENNYPRTRLSSSFGHARTNTVHPII